ncbi:cysteine desulfurase, partial [archaeon]
YHHHTIGVLLDSKGIAVRTGQHCAALLHKRLGVSGTVRVSYYIYNTVEEVEYLVHCLKEFAEKSK